MKRGRKRCEIDMPTMFRLWHDQELRTEDVALRLGIGTATLRRVASRHGLRHRVWHPSEEISEAPSAEEEAQSNDSLALSPWVAARAEEFRRQKEERGESLRGGVYLKTYSLRTLTAVE
jgi:hypothetical protein